MWCRRRLGGWENGFLYTMVVIIVYRAEGVFRLYRLFEACLVGDHGKWTLAIIIYDASFPVF